MRILLLAVLFGLTACTMIPEYQQPKPDLPPFYSQARDSDSKIESSSIDWRHMFLDEQLQKLIEQALNNNHDIRLAMLNVESVKTQYGIQRSELFPAINGNVSSSRSRALNSGSTTEPTSLQSQYGVTIGLNAYELDFFGRVRSLSDAALDRYLASEEGLKAAKIALISSVADAYYSALFAREQSLLAEKTLLDWRKSLDLAKQLKQAAQNSALDVAQAESQVAMAEANLQARQRGVVLAMNSLELLVGSPIPENLSVTDLYAPPLIDVPVGIPSELLVKRPDIIQAELKLKAANANIGAARAAFFPRIALTANAGYSSTELNGMYSGQNKVWTFAPQITVPIFQAGKLKSELKLAEIRKSVAIVEYEKAIRTAFKEVSDGLAGRQTYSKQIQAQQRVVKASERRVKLSTLRYKAGLDGRLELLDSQRQLYSADQSLLEQQRSEISNVISLYKALGGGINE